MASRAAAVVGSVVLAAVVSVHPAHATTTDAPSEPRVVDLAPRVVTLPARVVDLTPRVLDLRPRAEAGALSVPTDVLFAFGSATLSPDAGKLLAGLATRVAAARGERVTVTGYTDSVGTTAFNLDLSLRRAAAVRGFLSGRAPGVRLVVAGMGEGSPVAANEVGGKDNPTGRRLNRRVTVAIAG